MPPSDGILAHHFEQHVLPANTQAPHETDLAIHSHSTKQNTKRFKRTIRYLMQKKLNILYLDNSGQNTHAPDHNDQDILCQ